MKIYTKTGDEGLTGLFRGPRVPKQDPRIEAYGTVDELNALIGIVLSRVRNEDCKRVLSSIQHELFEVGADLATPPQTQDDAKLRIPPSMTERLENSIDDFQEKLPELQNFILPGGSEGASLLHYARTVCRRAERKVTLARENQTVNPEVLRYLNRLSDLLFVLARIENQTTGSPEILWQKRTL